MSMIPGRHKLHNYPELPNRPRSVNGPKRLTAACAAISSSLQTSRRSCKRTEGHPPCSTVPARRTMSMTLRHISNQWCRCIRTSSLIHHSSAVGCFWIRGTIRIPKSKKQFKTWAICGEYIFMMNWSKFDTIGLREVDRKTNFIRIAR